MPTVIIQLTGEGAVVEALVGISRPRADAMQSAGQQVPQPISLRLLIDSGASITSIQQGLLGPLNLQPTGSISLHSVTTGNNPVSCDQYDVSILLPTAFPVPAGF